MLFFAQNNYLYGKELSVWPLPSVENHLITFSFSSHALVCVWLEKTKKIPCMKLNAYEKHDLLNNEIIEGVLYNPTHILNIINNFLHKYHKNNAFVNFTLAPECLTEYFVPMPISTPKKSDFNMHNANFFLEGYRYLYQDDEGQYIFYTYSLSRALLLQYQLLAIHAQLNMLSVIPKTIALIGTYKTIFGAAFRASQFSLDMMQHNNNLETYITKDILQRIISLSPHNIMPAECINLAPACGLITFERFL